MHLEFFFVQLRQRPTLQKRPWLGGQGFLLGGEKCGLESPQAVKATETEEVQLQAPDFFCRSGP